MVIFKFRGLIAFILFLCFITQLSMVQHAAAASSDSLTSGTPALLTETPVFEETDKGIGYTLKNYAKDTTIDSAMISEAVAKLKSNNLRIFTIYVPPTEPPNNRIQIQLRALALINAAHQLPDGIIEIQTDWSSYFMPVSLFNFAALSEKWGIDLNTISLQITLEKVDEPTINLIKEALSPGETLLGNLVSFSNSIEVNGMKMELNLGGKYVQRTITIKEGQPSPAELTGIEYDQGTGKVAFVPATIITVDGTTTVTLVSPHNSVYGVIYSNKTFVDVHGHWAQNDIELLASKLIVKGRSATKFVPDENITRAEFTSLLVHSLGLADNSAITTFTDVSSGDWFAGAVSAAVKAGLVEGFKDGTFGPQETTTREQMAVMISKAVHLIGMNSLDTQNQLSKFMGQASMHTDFFPQGQVTRAEAVVILKHFLQYAHFINN